MRHCLALSNRTLLVVHPFPRYPETYLSSAILPIVIAILVGYVVAQIFFSVYDMAIDTVMLSFCEDCEQHDGTPHFAPPLLMEVMNASYPDKNKDK